ncbi:MAG: prolyl-tRNA synthetase associated domain-containing protein [Gammaproteobacteria bacterium]|nr:prolyl-tRNA synthetase associated domain-containing protein [Gammaproteobacteria bacterium]
MSHSDRPDPESVTLNGGEKAATVQEVLDALSAMGIEHHTQIHEPLFTVENAKSITYEIDGAHTKNLFLRNKKGRMFLLIVEQDHIVDLKALRDKLQLPGGQFAFASTERLGKFLGVVPGSVSALSVYNDHDNKVSVYIESTLLDHEWIYVHPCRNTHSTRLKTTELLKALDTWNHPATVLNF